MKCVSVLARRDLKSSCEMGLQVVDAGHGEVGMEDSGSVGLSVGEGDGDGGLVQSGPMSGGLR